MKKKFFLKKDEYPIRLLFFDRYVQAHLHTAIEKSPNIEFPSPYFKKHKCIYYSRFVAWQILFDTHFDFITKRKFPRIIDMGITQLINNLQDL